jgi:hypothetical protein
MQQSKTDERVTKLYTAKNGLVWYSVGIGPPINSEKIVDNFLLSPVVSGMGLCFRILGIPQNAELICALYLRQHKSEVRAIDVAGPNILNNFAELDQPALVLQRMRASTLSSSGGGWHELSMHDYPIYAGLAKKIRSGFVFDSGAKTYLHLHPAYKALTFIPGFSEEHTAALITDIIDPRWYVNRQRPDSPKKLELYLGLTPAIQRRVSNAQQILTKKRDIRCSTVLSAWKTADPATVDLNQPANFLYRIWNFCGGGWRGDLRASQAFVRYLCDNWLSVLDSRKGTKDGLFLPDRYFKTADERKAYAEHMQTDAKK